MNPATNPAAAHDARPEEPLKPLLLVFLPRQPARINLDRFTFTLSLYGRPY